MKIVLPKLGESIVSATVVQWFKKVGDLVALDEPLLEVSTDKVNSEIPSPSAGILTEILAQNDEEVEVGAPLAVLSDSKEVAAPKEASKAKEVAPECRLKQSFLSPVVARLLQEKGIGLGEVDKIPHTGEGGRLSKKDVEAYCATAIAAPTEVKVESGTERIPMGALRKAIADNMVKSFYAAPHASLITEVDVTNCLKAIQEYREKTGEKLTITAMAAKALVKALKAYPMLNASLDGDTIVVKHFINIGVAVSVDQGVMVPVVKQAEKLSTVEVGREIAELAQKTRSHSLTHAQTQGGTITMTNFGMTGVMIGVPIIRYPEVAIIGLGAIVKKVLALADDTMAIRSCMMVSLTFDHRILDGIYGCGFLNEFKKQLESASIHE